MEVRVFGAAKEVTGSCYSLEVKGEKILIDCGMFQGGKEMVRMNFEDFAFNPREYSALILTHAHLDHCGRIPKLIKYGFRGKIYATKATRDLAFIIMTDSAKIALEDTLHENRRRAEEGLPPRKPIYSDEDVKKAMKLFSSVDYNKDVRITKSILARFYDAGHILGAASIQLRMKDEKEKLVVFSGDLGQKKSILVNNTQPIIKADYVFIESTYGDRLHPPIEDRKTEFLRIIKETHKRGGKLFIPSFAVERTQELLYLIGDFMNEGIIPRMDVYLDSPMAMKATEVFRKYSGYYNSEIREKIKENGDVFDFPGLRYTGTVSESKMINSVSEPCIVIAGNGMCTGGRIKHHIKNNIEDSKNTFLFVGYQVQGTLGYWLKRGEKKIRLLGRELRVKARIEAIDGFSAHADYEELISWLAKYKPKPKKVFVVHGEEEVAKEFSKKIEKLGYEDYIPGLGESLSL